MALLRCFASSFDDETTSDIVLKAGETRVHAHKAILSAQSALFKAMFQVIISTSLNSTYAHPVPSSKQGSLRLVCFLQPGTKDNACEEVTMGQIEGHVLLALLKFMYGCDIVVDANLRLPLFIAADSHQASHVFSNSSMHTCLYMLTCHQLLETYV